MFPLLLDIRALKTDGRNVRGHARLDNVATTYSNVFKRIKRIKRIKRMVDSFEFDLDKAKGKQLTYTQRSRVKNRPRERWTGSK